MMLRIFVLIMAQTLWISSLSQLYWVDTGAIPKILSFDFVTEEITTVHDSLVAPFDLKILPDNQKLVWNDTLEAVIYMSNLDGSQLEVLMQVEDLIPYYFDVDENSDHIYCSGMSSEYVFVAEYYSTSVDTILDSGGELFSSVAFQSATNTLAVTRSVHFLELFDIDNENVLTLDMSLLSESNPNPASDSIGEIKATDSTDSGFYFLFSGLLYRILDGNEPEQLSFNSSAYEFFAFSSDPDRVYAGAGNFNGIRRHQELLFGEPDFINLQGQDLIMGHFALGMDVLESEPTLYTEIQGLGGLNLYPNPVNTHLTIVHQEPIEELRIFNACGQMIYRVPAASRRKLIVELSGLAEGYYLALIAHGDSFSSRCFSKK